MEFQYHNCLFLCVPTSEITGKKKKKIHTKQTFSFLKLQESQNEMFLIL